jgi:hypothetical protein
MKKLRLYVAGCLFVSAFVIFPVSLTLARDTLTAAQKKAIQDCEDKRVACNFGCDIKYGLQSSAPSRLQHADCKAQCKETYLTCAFSVRQSGRAPVEPGQISSPEVAPPKPPPKKISPEKVEGISDHRAGPTAAPATSQPPRLRDQVAPRRASVTATPTPTPTPAKR